MGTSIIRSMPRGMPTPTSGQTLICKNVASSSSYSIVHIVTAGKTFYLMGFLANLSSAANTDWATLSIDGGSTEAIRLFAEYDTSVGTSNPKVSTGWPLAVISAGVEIKIKFNTTDATAFGTIWGWEE